MAWAVNSTLKFPKYSIAFLKHRLSIPPYIRMSGERLFIAFHTSSGFELWIKWSPCLRVHTGDRNQARPSRGFDKSSEARFVSYGRRLMR